MSTRFPDPRKSLDGCRGPGPDPDRTSRRLLVQVVRKSSFLYTSQCVYEISFTRKRYENTLI